MKIFIRLLLLIGILISIVYAPSALVAFDSITSDPEGWQGGLDHQSTLIWFVIIVIGYGYLFFQTILAIFGFLFAFKRRKGAFWFLIVPGMTGIIFGILWTVLLVLFDLEWPNSWPTVMILLACPFLSYLSGLLLRKTVLKR